MSDEQKINNKPTAHLVLIGYEQAIFLQELFK